MVAAVSLDLHCHCQEWNPISWEELEHLAAAVAVLRTEPAAEEVACSLVVPTAVC